MIPIYEIGARRTDDDATTGALLPAEPVSPPAPRIPIARSSVPTMGEE